MFLRQRNESDSTTQYICFVLGRSGESSFEHRNLYWIWNVTGWFVINMRCLCCSIVSMSLFLEIKRDHT